MFFIPCSRVSYEAYASAPMQQVPLDDAFFEALARAKQIHTDCQLLVVTNHQMIGYVSAYLLVAQALMPARCSV